MRSSKTGKQRSRVGTFGYTLLFAALMLLVMLSFGSMALPLAVTLVPQGLDWLYFVLMELSALTVSVLASAFTSYGHLFRCRDNQQLLALPIRRALFLRCAAAGVPDRPDLSAAGVGALGGLLCAGGTRPGGPCWRRCR